MIGGLYLWDHIYMWVWGRWRAKLTTREDLLVDRSLAAHPASLAPVTLAGSIGGGSSVLVVQGPCTRCWSRGGVAAVVLFTATEGTVVGKCAPVTVPGVRLAGIGVRPAVLVA